jgi:hypothetical protein
MGRARAAVAVLATAWLGLTAMAVGGVHERFDPARATHAVAVHAGSALGDVVAATPVPRVERWSKRSAPTRIPLAIAVAVIMVAAVRRRWPVEALVASGDRRAWVALTAAPRGPPTWGPLHP